MCRTNRSKVLSPSLSLASLPIRFECKYFISIKKPILRTLATLHKILLYLGSCHFFFVLFECSNAWTVIKPLVVNKAKFYFKHNNYIVNYVHYLLFLLAYKYFVLLRVTKSNVACRWKRSLKRLSLLNLCWDVDIIYPVY